MRVAERPRLVVDASVAAKWYLDDEEYSAESTIILQQFRSGRIGLLAPEQIRYEVPSAIRQAVRGKRVTSDQGSTAIELFLSLRLPTVRAASLITLGYQQALDFGCSLYDGLYLALAQSAGCPLVYADRRLRNTVAGRLPQAISIGDCQHR